MIQKCKYLFIHLLIHWFFSLVHSCNNSSLQITILSAVWSKDKYHIDFAPARTIESNKRKTHIQIIVVMWSVVKEIQEKQIGNYSGQWSYKWL